MTRERHPAPGIDAESFQMLQKSNKRLSQFPLSRLLAAPDRFESFSRRLDGLLLDFSRVRIDRQALGELVAAAGTAQLGERREALFSGQPVNVTEHRPALHMALRSPELLASVGGEEAGRVRDAQERMLEVAGTLHGGRLPDEPGATLRHIVHVGIGGSLLGPQLLCEALDRDDDAPAVHFLGSVDAHARERLIATLDPAQTLVVMVSKSFSTGDTLLHGRRLRDWLRRALGEEAAARRLYAVTSQVDRALAFGIPEGRMLYFSDWVGGRYSLWSPVSLSAAARIGPERFRRLLAGAAAMDHHFRTAGAADNLPVLMGLVGIWHRNVCDYRAWGVMPYDLRLRLLPAYLQQLIMESTGKSVDLAGRPARFSTAPVVFGEIGTDAQHSVFQALHQGSDIVPLNFVAVLRPDHEDREAQDELLANLLAQLTALAEGRSREQTRAELGGDEALLAHRSFDGNRPSELIALDRLSAHNLGLLLALYEHKVFVESVLWGVNAFDQWGVELGKTLAPGIQSALQGGASDNPGLAPLLAWIRGVREER